jgi:glutathione S-transferase
MTDNPMIDLYYAPTPNGWKISIMLEELGLLIRSFRSTSGPVNNSSRIL